MTSQLLTKQVLLLSEETFPHDFVRNYFNEIGYNVCQHFLNNYQITNMNSLNTKTNQLSGIVLSGMVENSIVDNLPKFISNVRNKFPNIPILLLCEKKIKKEKRLEISKAAKNYFKALQGFKAERNIKKDIEKLTTDFFIKS